MTEVLPNHLMAEIDGANVTKIIILLLSLEFQLEEIKKFSVADKIMVPSTLMELVSSHQILL